MIEQKHRNDHDPGTGQTDKIIGRQSPVENISPGNPAVKSYILFSGIFRTESTFRNRLPREPVYCCQDVSPEASPAGVFCEIGGGERGDWDYAQFGSIPLGRGPDCRAPRPAKFAPEPGGGFAAPSSFRQRSIHAAYCASCPPGHRRLNAGKKKLRLCAKQSEVKKFPALCYSPTVKFAVPSPLGSLTTVFGKGTCVTTPLLAPENITMKKVTN